jgi:hypothetical protein
MAIFDAISEKKDDAQIVTEDFTHMIESDNEDVSADDIDDDDDYDNYE